MTVSSSIFRSSRNRDLSNGHRDGRLAALLRHALRDNQAAPLTLPRLLERQGKRSLVFQAHRGNTVPLVIKLATQRNSHPVEAWVYRELGKKGVPVPEVHAYRAKLPRLALPCLVMSLVDGEPLFVHALPTNEERRLYADIGELLGRIHAVSLPCVRFGLGAFLARRAGTQYASWPGFITAYHAHPRSGRQLVARGLLPGYTQADLDLLSTAIVQHRFSAVLNHGDIGPDHILVRHGRIVGIIDPGQAFAGPAEYDLAYLACYISGEQLEHVLRGYGGGVDLYNVRLYVTLIAMHKAARAHVAGQEERTRQFSAIAHAAWSRLRGPAVPEGDE